MTIKVGIMGAAGYTGGELIRILIHHPNVEIEFAHSKTNAGNPLHAVHSDLAGQTTKQFSGKYHDDIDVLFLCMGHGDSADFLENNNFRKDLKIIDLSQDFRLKSDEHDFVYGLPELNREEIKKATRIANPGCFATAIQLALLPVAANHKINDEVHISAITGSTGAGVRPTSTTHFSWRNNNISTYKAFNHQHLLEINESMKQLQPSLAHPLNFIPFRGDFTRGIYASIYLNTDLDLHEAEKIYSNYYKPHPYTTVIAQNPDLKQVVNTNMCILQLDVYGDKLHIISIIDNLLKGASGQAVQNMNLMFGLDETTGLNLKASAF